MRAYKDSLSDTELAKERERCDALHRALEYEDVPDEVVLAVLAACPRIATVATHAGSLPLHLAARRASLAATLPASWPLPPAWSPMSAQALRRRRST